MNLLNFGIRLSCITLDSMILKIVTRSQSTLGLKILCSKGSDQLIFWTYVTLIYKSQNLYWQSRNWGRANHHQKIFFIIYLFVSQKQQIIINRVEYQQKRISSDSRDSTPIQIWVMTWKIWLFLPYWIFVGICAN